MSDAHTLTEQEAIETCETALEAPRRATRWTWRRCGSLY